eukprot:gnl/MRDRNA2_/MRDRNA2_90041_c0_seq1.p1 gnl/MRDRNA2_/MRDRNA2_90041_c0~~gnl/MRDRNA2_/MRDRNA2_90041_c0_seq1.p1  ORF type:complete len:164 (+),score=35.95 gnl/MRDRNA2_/MRDRNA2_90041_c0_seq1:109-600(+)
MPASIVVPSDITIAEEKYAIGKRNLRILERIGLLGMPPMLHIRYSKIDANDMKAVLTKKYDPDSSAPIVDVCRRRQEAIRKAAVAHNGLWAGAGIFAGMTWWSFRLYNYQSRLIALPFLTYIGTFVGKTCGDLITGANAQFGRDAFLGSLPGKTYFTLPASEE